MQPTSQSYQITHQKTEWLTKEIALIYTSKPDGYQYKSGEFTTWTIPHSNPDNRGISRHFSFASSPTENHLCFLSKFFPEGSSYKNQMKKLEPGYVMGICQPKGHFTLPEDSTKPLVFLAGGVGSAPFRSHIKFILDSKLNTPVYFFYANPGVTSVPLKDFFDQASQTTNLKMIYSLTREIPSSWTGETGHFTPDMIKKHIRDFLNYHYYLCGPPKMVAEIMQLIRTLQIPFSQVKLDPFTGY